MKRIIIASFILFLALTSANAREVKVRSVKGLRRAIERAVPGDTIVLGKGTYRLKESLRIEGKTDLAIIGDGAIISGGVRIGRWRLRKAKGMAEGARRLNLKRYPLSGVVTKGDPHLTGPSWSEFFADGRPMRLSEWPDGGPLPLDSVVVRGMGRIRNQPGDGFGTIAFSSDRPLEWKDPTLGWLSGCFRFGWTNEMVPIAAMGPGKTFTAGDLTNYGFGFQPGDRFQRWRVLNIPEEVTLPGEYSLDASSKTAVLMLSDSCKRLEMSVMKDPIIVLDGCERLLLQGFELCCSRGDGIVITAGRDVQVKDCDIHGLGHIAAKIDSASLRCGLSGCHLYGLGAGGVELAGGDRRNVVRGDNYVEGCRIHNYNRIENQYRVGVVMSGLGNRITACEFYDSASMAILMLGNDQTVEYCNVHHVCMDIEDNGALYYGRSFAHRGGVIRWNYFHDIDVPFNVRAVYHDDGSGAAEVYGNVFQRISSPPVQIGGGSYIRYHDNLFIDLPCAAIKVDGRLKTWGADRVPIMLDSIRHADSPAFRGHYPELEPYLNGDPAEPQHNTLINNVFCNVAAAFEKVVWSDHFYNNDIEGRANFFDEMHGNSKVEKLPSGLVLPKRVPPTSQHELHFIHDAFNGAQYGILDERHTAANGNSQ